MMPIDARHPYCPVATDDRPHRPSVEPEAERRDEVIWEPPDWTPVLRAHRRRDLVFLGALATALVALPVVRVALLERPLALPFWFWLPIVLVYLVLSLRSHLTAAGRADWEEETRREVRIEHALRHHVSIGETDRALVTERAERLDRNSGIAVVAYPLLVLVVLALTLESEMSQRYVVGVVALAGVVCGKRLVRSLRRGRKGTAWLADPLPRAGEGGAG